jgi:hypothetical protein
MFWSMCGGYDESKILVQVKGKVPFLGPSLL